MAYMMEALRTVMEWATVPVLAVAMCLPHGALVYWLSSSMVSLAQVRYQHDPSSPASVCYTAVTLQPSISQPQ